MKFCSNCGNRIKLPRTRRGQQARTCTRCGALLDGQQTTSPPRARDLAGCFPHERLRPFQKEVLENVELALRESKKFIILEAPVGFGKSAVAAALCQYLGSAYLLTSTKQLQDQYSADFGFFSATGKSNFTCLVPTANGRHLACSKGRCEVDWKLTDCPHYISFQEYDEHMRGLCESHDKCERLEDRKLCPYYEQKWDAFRSNVIVANYPFFLSELRFTEDVKRRKLLVCDEAHDLERQIVASTSFSLKRSVLESYDSIGDRASILVMSDLHSEDPTAWLEPLRRARGSLEHFVETNVAHNGMQERVASCNAMLESLGTFMGELDSTPSNWVVNGLRKTALLEQGKAMIEEVIFQPLDISAYTSTLFESADTVLLMSATIFSKDAFCRTLGIPQDRAAFIRIKDSSFPVENRRIRALNTAYLSRSTMESSLDTIARAIDQIMTQHSGERGVIHTTSYRQANYILEHVSERNRSRLSTTEGVSSRSTLLKAHGSTSESVLISPSLYEGVDLKDELSRFQVVVKVPYPDLSEKRTKVKLERDRAWYDWQTALRLVQTYGRSVRSESDFAVTYVLDSNFVSFVGSRRELFPQYFLDAIS